MFMRNNLIPTPVVDKNGRQTTVHKRNGAPAKASRIGSIPPTLGAVAPQPAKAVTKVGFGCTSSFNGAKFVPLNSGFFLDRAGYAEEARELMTGPNALNAAEVPEETLYEFLRLGIDPAQAGVLYVLSNGDVESLKSNPKFAAALPGDLGKQRIWGNEGEHEKTIDGVVDYLANAGIKPQKIVAALTNNLNDDMLANNVLSPHELADVFDRFTYSISKNEKKGTAGSRTLDAFVDGRLPYSLAEKKNGVSRPVSTHVLEALYPKNRKETALMSEDDRRQLVSDPEMIYKVAKVVETHDITHDDSVSASYRAIRAFGEEAALKYNPFTLTAKHSDGSVLGVDGALRALEVVAKLREYAESDRNINVWNRGTTCTVYNYKASININLELADLSEMRASGLSAEQVIDRTFHAQMDSRRALAIHKENIPMAVSDGWL